MNGLPPEPAFWSSHPSALRRRSKLFNRTAAGLASTAAAIWGGGSYFGWFSVASPDTWLRAAGLAGIAMLAVCLQVGLTARWGAMQAARRVQEHRADRVNWSVWVLFFVGLAVVAGLAPYLFDRLQTAYGFSPPRWARIAVHLFPILPIFVVLLFTGMTGEGRQPVSRFARNLLGVVVSLIGTLAALSLFYDVSAVMQRNGIASLLVRLFPWYADAQNRFLGVIMLGPLLAILSLVWTVWRTTEPAGEPEPAAPKPGPPVDPNVVPDWLSALHASAKAAATEVTEPERVVFQPAAAADGSGPGVAPLASGGLLRETGLMAPLVPTEDQERAFTRIVHAYQQSVESGARGLIAVDEQPAQGADLLVHGPAGSGKTSLLVAASLHAALVRGQRVLYLVPNVRRGETVIAALRERLAAFQLQYYTLAESLHRDSVKEWLRACAQLDRQAEAGAPRTRQAAALFPSVLVATPEDVERHLYGFAVETDHERIWVNQLLASLALVVVDGFLEFEELARSHLAFFLDRHRLLLASRFLFQQTIVACSELGEGSDLHARLFAEKSAGEGAIRLRPRPVPPIWQMNVTASNVDALLDTLVPEAVAGGRRVLLYRRDLPDEQAAQLEDQLRKRARAAGDGGAGALKVIGDLDRLPVDFADSSVVFFQVGAHDDALAGLRARLTGEAAAIVAVMAAGEQPEKTAVAASPVLVERTALPMVARHLAAVQPFLPAGLPVPVDYWRRLGVPAGTAGAADPEARRLFSVLFDDYRDETYGARIWPYAFLEKGAPSRAASRVDLRSLPDERDVIRISPAQEEGSTRVIVERAAQAPAAAAVRPVRWVSSAGEELPPIDLTYFREARLEWGGGSLAFQGLRAHADRIEFLAQAWRGPGRHYTIPCWDHEWTIPADAAFRLDGGSFAHGFRWALLEQPGHAPLPVQGVLTRLYDEIGRHTECDPPVPVLFGASVSALLLQPVDRDLDTIRSAVARALAGAWKTGADGAFMPELTGAFCVALDAALPGLTLLAKPLAFQLEGPEAPAVAVVFFLETTRAGAVAARRLKPQLDDPAAAERLLGLARGFLDRLAAAPSAERARLLRRYARIAFAGDEALSDPAPAIALLENVRSRAQAQAEALKSL